MECNHCRKDSILFQPYSGQHLCARHFTLDVERRAKRVIRKNGWICPGDRIAVAVNGDARSMALLHFLVSTFGARQDLSFFIVTIDSIDGNLHCAPDLIMQKYGLEVVRLSVEAASGKATVETRGKVYWTLRQRCMQKIAQEHHATRIATGSTLDDEAVDMVADVLRGDISRIHPSAVRGALPCLRPFIAVPEQEVILYACLHTGIRNAGDAYPSNNRPHPGFQKALREFTFRHPATPFALAHLRATLTKSVQEAVRQSCNQPGEDVSQATDIPARQRESPHAM
jgi:tRNA(Ile)-lysidine synthase TilS/MesJ